MSNKTAAIIIASLVFVTFAGMGVWLSSRSTPQPLTIPESKIPAFRVLTDKTAYDNPLRSQVETAVFMEERVTEESIRLLLEHLYELAKEAGPFQYRQHPNYIFIRIYARKGQAQIAWGLKSPNDEFHVTIRDELLATVNDPPIVKLGLTESERQMIWRDFVRVEDRAHHEAEELYPFPMPKNDLTYTETGEKNQLERRLDYATELMKRYRTELAESLGLTIEQLEEIGSEGMKNWWETPAIH